MLTGIMKWITMAALLIAAILWRSAANSQFSQYLLGFVVCLGAGVVAAQAVRTKKYVWAAGFDVLITPVDAEEVARGISAARRNWGRKQGEGCAPAAGAGPSGTWS